MLKCSHRSPDPIHVSTLLSICAVMRKNVAHPSLSITARVTRTWVTFKAKVTNTSVFDHEISAKDILNAFGGNQGKTELIFEKGKYRPNPRLLPGGGSVYSKLTKDIHKQTVWHPSDQHLHVFNFSVVRSFAYERFVFPNQKVFKNFLSFADLNSRTKRIHTRRGSRKNFDRFSAKSAPKAQAPRGVRGYVPPGNFF